MNRTRDLSGRAYQLTTSRAQQVETDLVPSERCRDDFPPLRADRDVPREVVVTIGTSNKKKGCVIHFPMFRFFRLGLCDSWALYLDTFTCISLSLFAAASV